MGTLVKPYQSASSSKKEQVANMFNNIAHSYDFLNHFLSAGIDIWWRKSALNRLKKFKPENMLDIATGTGDFAIMANSILSPNHITGLDISEGMLKVGNKKITSKNLQSKITLVKGDSENLQFEANTFDAITVAFGIRNFENLQAGLTEMYRVLKPQAPLLILEFSHPSQFPIKQFYHFYSRFILPFLGSLVSKDKAAYTYLPESVEAFPAGKKLMDIIQQNGFKAVELKQLSGGIASIYLAQKI